MVRWKWLIAGVSAASLMACGGTAHGTRLEARAHLRVQRCGDVEGAGATSAAVRQVELTAAATRQLEAHGIDATTANAWRRSIAYAPPGFSVGIHVLGVAPLAHDPARDAELIAPGPSARLTLEVTVDSETREVATDCFPHRSLDVVDACEHDAVEAIDALAFASVVRRVEHSADLLEASEPFAYVQRTFTCSSSTESIFRRVRWVSTTTDSRACVEAEPGSDHAKALCFVVAGGATLHDVWWEPVEDSMEPQVGTLTISEAGRTRRYDFDLRSMRVVASDALAPWSLDVAEDARPVWYPTDVEPDPAPARLKPSDANARAAVPVPLFESGALGWPVPDGVRVEPLSLAGDDDGLRVLSLARDITESLCLRTESRWRCSAPHLVPYGHATLSARHVRASGRNFIVATRDVESADDVADHELRVLHLYEYDAATVVLVATLPIGEWACVQASDGEEGHVVERYFLAWSPETDGTITFSGLEMERVGIGEDLRPRSGAHSRPLVLREAPARIPFVVAASAGQRNCGEGPPLEVLDLRGRWRIDDGAWVRVAAVAGGSAARAAPPSMLTGQP